MDKPINYFKILNMKEDFDISKEKLYENYISILQSNNNVDSKISSIDIILEEDINKAYLIIKNDIKRAEHLIYLNNIQTNNYIKVDINKDPLFLNSLMEYFEIIESSDSDIELDKIKLEINKISEDLISKIKKDFKLLDFNEAKLTLEKIKYVKRLYDKFKR